MKAVVVENYGPPDVLQVKDVPRPEIKPDEVLVKVRYSTVNRTDTGMRSAEYVISRLFSGLFKPKFMNFGNEFAGDVVDIGKNVTNFKLNDRVFGYDDVKFNCHAEYKAIKARGMITHIPQEMSYEQAAPILEGAHYMLFYLRAAKVGKSTKVLVNGGTGAIGSSAVQIMSYIGADVTATADAKNVSLVKKLGAKKVINRDENDFTQLSDAYDFIFDSVGKSTFAKCKPVLKQNGFYASSELGEWVLQNPLLALRSKFWGRKKVLFPIPKNNVEDMLFLRDLAEKGAFVPLIDKTYDLEDIVEATKYVESGQKIGNVLLKISG
jgi:NADPH:quinone reductase-like Zn-dependent oxidoreductase